jgi:hypothetical protein
MALSKSIYKQIHFMARKHYLDYVSSKLSLKKDTDIFNFNDFYINPVPITCSISDSFLIENLFNKIEDSTCYIIPIIKSTL